MTQAHEHNHTFAHSMVAGAVDRMANDPATVTEFDRLAIILGAALEVSEENLRLSRDIITLFRHNPNSHNGPRRFRDRAKQSAPPIVMGGGLVGILVAILDKL